MVIRMQERLRIIKVGDIMSNKSNLNQFITTSDKQQRQNLINLGFQETPSGNSFFMFVNNSTLKFDDNVDMEKLRFTNMLCV